MTHKHLIVIGLIAGAIGGYVYYAKFASLSGYNTVANLAAGAHS